MNQTIIGERIRERREKLQMSQGYLAQQSGIHYMTISRYERGRRTPSTAALVALARALGVTTDWLLGAAS